MARNSHHKHGAHACHERGSRQALDSCVPTLSRHIDLALINEDSREMLKCCAMVGFTEAIEQCHIQDLAALGALFNCWKPTESLEEAVELVFPSRKGSDEKRK